MAAEPDTYSFDQLLDELEGLSRYPDPDPADAASDTASEDGSPDGRPSSFAHFKERLREATTSMSPVTSEAEAELEQRARPSKTVSLTPRMYQDQLFEKAKRHNIIACLDTGSGKTLVSVLLLQYMYDQEIARIEGLTGNASTCSGGNAGWLSATSPRPDKRISVFCVNLVPLVHQQGDVISINSSLTVAKLYGELNVDNWNVAQWQKTLESNDVIVATARIILDALIHGFLSMKNINLIIL